MPRVPVLAIFGSTGCGKTRLSIELAKRFSGEIISADSMQVYKGLDIITAKATKEEKAMAPHHMLDIVDPLNLNFTVLQYRNMTLPIIDDLLAKQKFPIIVGGTNYYIEALLWNTLVEESIADSSRVCYGNKKKRKIELDRDSTESNEELFAKLKKVDPEMAKRLHPNNRRKIIRSLEVFEQFGIPHSELLKTQRAAGGCGLGGPLRYTNSLILWLHCEQTVLEERLDSRVDAMMEAGLVQELLDFHQKYNEQRIQTDTLPDYTKGIFQSIGFKEFHSYLTLPEEERQTEKGQKLLSEGIDTLKLVTRKYARKQQKWVKNRILRRNDRQAPALYVLDCTDLNQWDSCVYDKAVNIIEAILRGEKPSYKSENENIEDVKLTDSSIDECHYCEICERFFVGPQWDDHLNSKKHEKVLRKKKRLEKQKMVEIKMSS